MSPTGGPSTGEFEVLTSFGPAAIAVIRVRGPLAAAFVGRHIRTRRPSDPTSWRPGEILRAALLDADGVASDDILLSVHATPPTWDLRLHLHGSPWLVRCCTDWLRACGLVGGVEERTTLWPASDTLQAEAYALLPRMLTRRGAGWLLRQVGLLREAVAAMLDSESPDTVRPICRELAGRIHIVDWFARPLQVVLAGPPNAGKSTLANALADQAVSLVSPTPGTTRDWVEVAGEACGHPVVWLDTAGLRESTDALEGAGVARTGQLIRQADALLVVLDVTRAAAAAQAAFLETHGNLQPACVALNKSDLNEPTPGVVDALPAAWRARAVAVSATRRSGLEALRTALLAGVGRTEAALDQPAAFTARQVQTLEEAATASDRGRTRSALQRLLHDTPATSAGPRSLNPLIL